MSDPIEELAVKLLETCELAGESENRVLQRLKDRLLISRNTVRKFEGELTLGQRLADRIARFGGSWTCMFISVAAR